MSERQKMFLKINIPFPLSLRFINPTLCPPSMGEPPPPPLCPPDHPSLAYFVTNDRNRTEKKMMVEIIFLKPFSRSNRSYSQIVQRQVNIPVMDRQQIDRYIYIQTKRIMLTNLDFNLKLNVKNSTNGFQRKWILMRAIHNSKPLNSTQFRTIPRNGIPIGNSLQKILYMNRNRIEILKKILNTLSSIYIYGCYCILHLPPYLISCIKQ